ncbi:hypothetical protein P4T54_24875 [Bacillus mycoides]|uniref:hypothetical protein n=1 Tax=Bacillus mycoides TaxID=1405 RepID=UPI002E1B9ABA|nr:hypothetical protein [Bacillus mycoides]MED1047654.1 hypothetical protein [Bacillus mycoides]MED1054391.1 hypothetical protein [Bacillus mycoides]MED1086952.1 hypothetical protein [Bacillus mycoides]
MTINLIGSATSHKTDAGSLVESFIDYNKEDLSINMIEALEKLAAEIDDHVENELSELEYQIENLQMETEDLREELEEVING